MVELSISDIRRELWLQWSPESHGDASTPLLGQIFHETAAELLGDDKFTQWQAALDRETISDRSALTEHIYEKILGPRLTARQASLHAAGEQLLGLWQATSAFSEWISGLLSDAFHSRRIQFDTAARQWTGDPLCLPEHALVWDVFEPGWQSPVRVSGIADCLWRNAATGRWCVVEYKLGRGAPEVDLAQVCLYHEMLVAAGLAGQNGALALIAFKPERQQTLFPSAKLTTVKAKLRLLIGRLAGVSSPSALTKVGQASACQEDSQAESSLTAQRLLQTYAQYGVNIILIGEPIVGPSFIRYTVMPARGVKVNQIRRLQDELQVHLNLATPPMIHTESGRLVIDVKRAHPQPVLFSSIVSQLPKPDSLHGSARVPLGVDLVGALHFADLSQNTCPHLLVAGTSGSGKSEWLRSAIAGLIRANTPKTLQLVLIDPKRSAFNDLENSPYIYDSWGILHPADRPIAEVLDAFIGEMDHRNLLFKQKGVDHLAAYVEITRQPLPRIILFCDEYFDLIADKKSRPEIESRIARLGAKGRSSGIHLVLATQFPKADVVTTVIKANLSGRVCLRLTDARQSHVVLGQSGGERLLGQGDLLFEDIGEPRRLQAPYLPESERKQIFASSNS